jgi:hypothetical protein
MMCCAPLRDRVAVGGVGETQAEDRGVLFGLLDAGRRGFVFRFGRDDGPGVVAAIAR